MKISGFSLFRINGSEIVIDVIWLVMFFLITLFAENTFAQMYPEQASILHWTLGGIVSALVFVSVLIHELAHAFVSAKFGNRIERIRLHIFGCPVVPESRSARQEFVVTIAGWAANIALGSFCLGLYSYFWFQQSEHFIRGVAAFLASANFLLAAVHMIPGFPLDGGRILRAILWDRWNDVARSTRIVSQISNGLGLFFIIFGILQVFVTQSLIPALVFVVIGIYIKVSAVVQFKTVVEKRVLADTRIRQVMSPDVVTVDWLISVEELVHAYMYKYRHTYIPACNREETVGMISLDAVKSVSKDLWTFKQVRDIMVPIEDVPCAKPEEDASDILKRMESEKIACMPVMENGRLIGIVTRNDIVKMFRIKSELGIA